MNVAEQYERITETKTAPGDLRLVQGFVNTTDFEDQGDYIGTPDGLSAWLTELGLMEPGAAVDESDVERARELREAIRSLLHANHGDELDPGALDTINRIAERSAVTVRFAGRGEAGLAPAATGPDGAFGRFLAIVYTSLADGSWERLKACRADTCQWAFYDRSKNRSGSWCSMDGCGNRAKARAYRQRRRPGQD
jgi:predicted RNA-binding Zn ribbon-like protein